MKQNGITSLLEDTYLVSRIMPQVLLIIGDQLTLYQNFLSGHASGIERHDYK